MAPVRITVRYLDGHAEVYRPENAITASRIIRAAHSLGYSVEIGG